MRVPVAKASVGVQSLRGPSASPTAFGAGIGAAVQDLGAGVQRAGAGVSNLLAEMQEKKITREAEDGYASWLKGAHGIYNNEVTGRLGSQTDDLLEDGFRDNFTTHLDKQFETVAENLSPAAKPRFEKMIFSQRLALETRAANHVFTQQNEAAKQASVYARDTAAESYGVQAQQYTKKQPDGTVSIDWNEVDRLMPDVVAAQRIYNDRHGIESEVTLEDGTKQNIMAKSARAVAHTKAIETMLAGGEFDEADAYLAGILERDAYKGDLDAPQVKLTRDAISGARNKEETRQAKASNEAFIEWQLANPEAEITLSKVQELGLPPDFQVKVMRAEQKAVAENRKAGDDVQAAQELLPMVMSYNPAEDPTRETAQALYQRIHSLPGELGGFLGKIFNEQYQAAQGKPGAKSKAYVLGELADTLLSDPKKGTAADFKRGWGKGWTDEEAVKQVALEQDRFLRWVEQTSPTDEEILNYTETNERWKALKGTQNLKTFRRGAPESLRLNFSPASLNDVQGAYLDEKSSLSGLLD